MCQTVKTMSKRRISGFLVGPKGERKNSDKPEIFESSAGRKYVIAILEGGVDVETGEITPESVYPLGLPEDQLKLVKSGMIINVEEES